jgi:hypothetical protein
MVTTFGGIAMDLVIGLIVIGLIIWGLTKLADYFEERSFVFWLIFYILGGGLCIMLLKAAGDVG